ncbi:MAG: DUF5721 family protein [Lachnospiraceae bacterium]|nr:DUF5721 family protein [Lachnospiraceae bacterium]
MISIQINSLKSLMTPLLTGDTFYSFLLEKARICVGCTFEIDGHVNAPFYEGSGNLPEYDLQEWKDLQNTCYQLIKGKQTPTSFNFTLHLKPEKAHEMLEKEYPEIADGGAGELLRALILNIYYDGTRTTVTTSTSYKTFVPDKTIDQIWDRAATRFLGLKGVSFEIM